MLLVGEEVFVVGEEVCAMAAKDGTRNRFDDLNDAGAVELWPVGRLRIIRCRCSRTVADGADAVELWPMRRFEGCCWRGSVVWEEAIVVGEEALREERRRSCVHDRGVNGFGGGRGRGG